MSLVVAQPTFQMKTCSQNCHARNSHISQTYIEHKSKLSLVSSWHLSHSVVRVSSCARILHLRFFFLSSPVQVSFGLYCDVKWTKVFAFFIHKVNIHQIRNQLLETKRKNVVAHKSNVNRLRFIQSTNANASANVRYVIMKPIHQYHCQEGKIKHKKMKEKNRIGHYHMLCIINICVCVCIAMRTLMWRLNCSFAIAKEQIKNYNA